MGKRLPKTALNSAGACKRAASVVPCASSANWRRAEKAASQQLQKVPSAKTIARMMTLARDQLSRAESVTVAAIEASAPALVEAQDLIDCLHAMVRRS
jgi:hypothetical protein